MPLRLLLAPILGISGAIIGGLASRLVFRYGSPALTPILTLLRLALFGSFCWFLLKGGGENPILAVVALMISFLGTTLLIRTRL